MTVADIHTPARAQPRRSLKIGRLSLPWFFLFPAIATFVIWIYAPLVQAAWLLLFRVSSSLRN